jgi:hypothetical protein
VAFTRMNLKGLGDVIWSCAYPRSAHNEEPLVTRKSSNYTQAWRTKWPKCPLE